MGEGWTAGNDCITLTVCTGACPNSIRVQNEAGAENGLKMKKPLKKQGLIRNWRKGEDSNLRYACAYV